MANRTKSSLQPGLCWLWAALLLALLVLTAACGGAVSDGSIDGGTDANHDVFDGASVAMAPQFSPRGGTFTVAPYVTITSGTPGAAIHFTVDGTEPGANSPVYSEPILASPTTTINAIATAPGYEDSPLSTATYTCQCTVATPHFSLPAGSYNGAQTLEISTTTPKAQIHYTTDGTDPDVTSFAYTEPIDISETTTLRAFAVAEGYADSEIAEATYSFEDGGMQAGAPTFTPPGGTYTSPLVVTISSYTAGAEIHFTVDGTDPGVNSPVFTAPIHVSSPTTIKAMATAPGYYDSPISTATYSIQDAVAVPVFSLPAGTYDGTQTVAITVTTPNARIFYTSDGSDPTGTSTEYVAPISIATTTTLRAFAVAAGYADSGIAEATYTIHHPESAHTPVFLPHGGTYSTAQSVTMSSTSVEAVIHFTMDGTDPTLASQIYAGPIEVATSLTLKAFATAPNFAPSPIATAVYTIEP